MKKKKYIILIICSGFLIFFLTSLAIANKEGISDMTLANIEALSTDEGIVSPCNVANGFCFTSPFPIAGIHFE